LVSETGWKAYTSQKEKFSAVFPGEVNRQFFGFLEDDGESPGFVVYSSKSRAGVTYDVRVTRVMEYHGSPAQFLKTALAEMAGSMGDCAIVRQRNELFRGRPAIAFEAKIRGVMSVGVVVLHGKRCIWSLCASVQALRMIYRASLTGSRSIGTAGR
jgi:hypothetical protein